MHKFILTMFLIMTSLIAGNKEVFNSSLGNSIPGSEPLTYDNFKKTLKQLSHNKGIGASYALGAMHLVGNKEMGIKQNYNKAYEYFLKDSNSLSIASYKLGEMNAYNLLQKDQCKCNEDAIKWFKKTLDNKDTLDYKAVYPFANAAIGHMYLTSQSDPIKALPYFIDAANSKSLPRIELLIGTIYNEAKLSVYNEDEANYWLNRAWKNPNTTSSLRQQIMRLAEASK